MIKHLILNNLVLVDSCEIHFGPSFNVVTGETGAGKTALIEAIDLALGGRADTSVIRKGCDRAFVEIAFDIEHLDVLEEAGITLDKGEYLVIRREIAREGKNRAFVNCRMAPLPLLQKIGNALIDLIGQHAHQTLRTADSQRALVDRFGDVQLGPFQQAYEQEKSCQKRLDELSKVTSRDEEMWRFQLDEIQSVGLKDGEEEALFEKHHRLAHSNELSEKIDMMIKGLSESSLPQLACYSKACGSLLKDTSALIHDAQVSLAEALRTLQSYDLENDPQSFQALENRLSDISRLKRKYGQTFAEIEAYRQKLCFELSRLENLSEEIEKAQKELKKAHEETDKAAHALSLKRKQAAAALQKTLTEQLQSLNMPGAELIIEISPQARQQSGDDLIQFFLKANQGEHPGLVKEHSSGGELSRLLFAIKIALAEKNDTPTLIFDEIDANVGGKTAAIIGEKLHELGKCRQVICITHFPQVASKSDCHFSVQKTEKDGRTLTEIKPLSKKEREQELLRMIGGKSILSV